MKHFTALWMLDAGLWSLDSGSANTVIYTTLNLITRSSRSCGSNSSQQPSRL